MCGIVGAIAERDITPILLEGLSRLEYRGYDSAGVAVLEEAGVARRRCLGKVQGLKDKIAAEPVKGGLGIAHTRWATHGVPSELNAHPHMSGDDLAIVHNGIIENYEELRIELKAKGYEFSSETDTEVIVHLINETLKTESNLFNAVKEVEKQLEGAYALAVIEKSNPDHMVVLRYGSPLVIGLGIGENFIASDQLALLPVTNRFVFLEEGDCAEITRDSITIFNEDGKQVERELHEFDASHEDAEKGEYRHYMQKEIFEQPLAVQKTLEGRIENGAINFDTFGPNAKELLANTKAVQIVACGTSYHAGMVARYWIESFVGIPCQVEVASEFRYRDTVAIPDSLFVTISQSGETADTLAALRKAKNLGYSKSIVVCNVPGSSLVRESDLALMTKAGPEIGVASTKAFTTQLVGLLLLTLGLRNAQGKADKLDDEIVSELQRLPSSIELALKLDKTIEKMAEAFAEKNHTIFLGRGPHYPIAMEGALKLKEISYIHAEAYPAGELKHGPLALIDAEMPVVAIAPNDELLEKLKSNLQEVRARGGELFLFACEQAKITNEPGVELVKLNKAHDVMAPIVYTIPLQLFSYHVAVIKGTDVDQPRNLAKSVTVE